MGRKLSIVTKCVLQLLDGMAWRLDAKSNTTTTRTVELTRGQCVEMYASLTLSEKFGSRIESKN